ncbi:MAG TPA: toll/interleukin-1 receptor domain-containing protein [Ktedonosporobacter sp.]|jgi:hypothetical protein|nr:toll/interleukin-1 receptor domain-containing protein [Ktedonosporobacter sp.]
MARQEHLKLIKQGVAAWNAWRQQHPEIRADLRNANLRRAKFREADFSRAKFSGAKLSEADFFGADLSEANLSRAYLIGADFFGADLSDTDLSHVDLSHADLRVADLIGANLSGANLSHADFFGADLSGADLSHARFWGTRLGDRDLRVMKGLETIQHNGPSALSINTIYQSEGDIPEVFVRGTGAPDSFLEYMRALAAKPIEYYTCFISYSSNDQDFAERLYADLQSNNVRCWYAPKDLKPGDFYRYQIEESIKVYDKLVLVLSQHSIKSKRVEEEVQQAWEREMQPGAPLVLFPIRVDDAVMRTERSWAAGLRSVRHISDFTRWKEHDAYQQGLQRLLRDLKAESTRQDV